jgi:hypothetical protein
VTFTYSATLVLIPNDSLQAVAAPGLQPPWLVTHIPDEGVEAPASPALLSGRARPPDGGRPPRNPHRALT